MAEMTGGQALVAALQRHGVDTIFGLPGVQLDALFDALFAARDQIRLLHTRHEQACSYMADGYARTTGKVGMALVVPGPGLLNAAAGLATAYATSSPVFCLTGQIDSKQIGVGRGELHEIPKQSQMLESVTKWAARPTTPAEIPGLVDEAFHQLRSGRPRPAALEVSPDILGQRGEVSFAPIVVPAIDAGDPDLLRQAAAMLQRAERPVILAGGGITSAGAWQELQHLAERLEAPVVMSFWNGRGALSDRHYLAHTMLSLRHLAPTADLFLAVGTRLVELNLFGKLPDGVPLIQIDTDSEEIGRNRTPTLGITADARAGLAQLVALVDGGPQRPSREQELTALKERIADLLFEVQPQHSLTAAIRSALPDDGIVVSEMTQLGYYSTLGLPLYEPRTYLTPGYQGTLGFGYATALGAQVGNPKRRVVSICGDGGFMYSVQELATAKQHNIPVVAIVFNDNAYGNVKRIQQHRLGGHTYGSELQNPDFQVLARAFGVAGRRATNADELAGTLREALATNGPSLIEVPLGEVPDMFRALFAP